MTSLRSDKSKLVFIALVSSLISCGLLIPLWLVVFAIIVIAEWACPPPKIQQPKIETVYPSNVDADDWEYKFYEVR